MLIADFVPDELRDTADRLENWGRWAYEYRRRGRAASAEGRYRPRFGNNQSEEDEKDLKGQGSLPEIDAEDAQIVGRAISPYSGFPYHWYVFIKLRYYQRARKQQICRRLNVHISGYDGLVTQALYAARNHLTPRERIVDNSGVSDATS
jgi:hypothetical protein